MKKRRKRSITFERMFYRTENISANDTLHLITKKSPGTTKNTEDEEKLRTHTHKSPSHPPKYPE